MRDIWLTYIILGGIGSSLACTGMISNAKQENRYDQSAGYTEVVRNDSRTKTQPSHSSTPLYDSGSRVVPSERCRSVDGGSGRFDYCGPHMTSPKEFFLGDLAVRHFVASQNPKGRAVLYFHGFPGPVVEFPGPSLDEPFSEFLLPMGYDLLCFRYSGLGQSRGDVNFVQTVEDGLAVERYALEQGYSEISHIGYSWGASVSSIAWSEIPHQKRGILVYLAPWVYYPDHSGIEKVAAGMKTMLPMTLGGYPLSDMIYDVDMVARRLALSERLTTLKSNPRFVVQGENDEVVPAALGRRFADELEAELIMLPENHSFGDRVRLSKAVQRVFENFQ